MVAPCASSVNRSVWGVHRKARQRRTREELCQPLFLPGCGSVANKEDDSKNVSRCIGHIQVAAGGIQVAAGGMCIALSSEAQFVGRCSRGSFRKKVTIRAHELFLLTFCARTPPLHTRDDRRVWEVVVVLQAGGGGGRGCRRRERAGGDHNLQHCFFKLKKKAMETIDIHSHKRGGID